MQNMDDFYLTVFSNASTLQHYPDNSTSRFRVKLPKPLELDDGQWSAAVVDIYHPPILGVKKGEGAQDVIILPFIVSEHSFLYDLHAFCTLLLTHAKRPELYTKRYFNDFLNIENLREFELNAAINKHQTTPGAGKQVFKISPFAIATQYRASLTDKEYILLESYRAYTLRQVLWCILHAYYKIFTTSQSDEEILEKYGIVVEKERTIAETLYMYALTFCNTVRFLAGSNIPEPETTSNYILVYSNLIDPSIVGDTYARLLFITSRQTEVNKDIIQVQNIKYMNVSKKYVDEISFLFCDEQGRQIVFEDGYLPTCIVLHFHKKAAHAKQWSLYKYKMLAPLNG